ncbi:hypothetical protein GCM10011578_099130 [Streptomyces fuscichromogenes]|uniref:Uncharacterized protein n=1 Tax=Streptomyces fuscichromogenes TaxID=1324013 RepID=A0A918CY02_9ACTN|nr:hypothetical protein GCM10011578_099130 [Streptomyces fuscichromogenes]
MLPKRGWPAATLHLNIDPAEHTRRQQTGLRHIRAHWSLLDTLMELPPGVPVPVDNLTKRQQDDVRRAPAGVLDLNLGLVTRHAIRPCRVTLATVFGTCTRERIGKASTYAPVCSRAIVTPAPPRRDYLLTEADYWGIGVLLDHGDGELETLVTPAPWQPQRHTPAAWHFAETAYASYLEHAPAPNHPGEEPRGRKQHH